MGDRRIRQNSVPEIEDVWSIGEGVKDSPGRRFELLAAGDKGQRIEVSLDWQLFRQLFRGPGRIDRLIETDRANSSLTRISAELAAGALGEADHRHFGMALLECRNEP